MIKIHKDFVGGNIRVVSEKENEIFLENELRDTVGDWFYWAFCVKGANGKTLTFDFGTQNWIGHFGPAISHNLKEWNWLNDKNGYNSFTYTFKDDEDCVYFAHHQLYHPDRFYELGKNKGIDIKTLCTSEKGNDVPYFEYGNGDKIIFLTARHHACESTGNYVMEGIIDSFVDDMIDGYKIVCVPFVDFDGVIIPAFDARRRQVYACVMDGDNVVCDDFCRDVKILEKYINETEKDVYFVGDGKDLCYNTYKDYGNVKHSNVEMPCIALGACLLAKAEYAAVGGKTHFDLSPSYLRLSQAERELKEKMEAQQ